MTNWFRIIVFALVLIPSLAEAQSFYAIRRNRDLMVSAGSGIAYYKGDLVDSRELGVLKPNIAFGAEYFVMPRISVRAGLTWFQTAGNDKYASDEDRQARYLHFRSSNIELNATGAINLIPTGVRFYQRARINLHAFAGIGLLYFNPKAQYDGKWVALAPLQTENKKYSRIQPVIPFGLGVRIKVDPFFNVIIEGGYRKTFTDYLDDVSGDRYVDPTTLKSEMSVKLADRIKEGLYARGLTDEQIAKQYKAYTDGGWHNGKPWRRGNSKDKDGYFIGNITIQYYLPNQVFSGQRKLYNRKRKAIYRKR
jgi:hypothetical protein